MSGNSTHAKGSGIVNLPAQPLLALSAYVLRVIPEIIHLSSSLFSWSNPGKQICGRLVRGVLHSQRLKNILARKLVECLTAHSMHHFAQRDEADIAVDKTTAGGITQRFAIQTLNCFVVANPSLAQVEIRSKA